VISDSSASCIANVMANSAMGKVYLDTERVNKLFGKTDLVFDTTNLKPFMPIFYEKAGEGRPLMLEVDFKEIKVLFG